MITRNPIPKTFLKTRLAATMAALLLGGVGSAPALIIGPYAPDAHTVHLWHFDDPTGITATNAVSGGQSLLGVNGATQVNPLPTSDLMLTAAPGFSGFGSAATFTNTVRTLGLAMDGNGDGAIQPDNLSTADKVALSTMVGANGAFTIEALVRLSQADITELAASGTKEIVCTDNSAAARGFQFRFNGSILDFNPINVTGGQLTFDLANLFDANAYTPNTWFHVAVTYNGLENTPDNLKLYWTRVDAANTQANLVASKTLAADMNPAVLSVIVIGNDNRAAFGEGFGGSNGSTANHIDEVRLSNVARGAGEMLFASPIITFTLNPADTLAALGQAVTLTSEAGGIPPLFYQWRHYGTNLPGATDASYHIPAVTAADSGPYDVVVTNLISAPATSAIGTLTVRTTVDSLVWNNNNSFDFNWDYLTANWSNSVSRAFPVVYRTGDNVRLDDTGLGYTPISLTAAIMPGSVVVHSDMNYYTIAGPGSLSGPMSLTKSGAATLYLESNNDYTGTTTVNAGVLQLGTSGTTGTLGSGDIINQSQIAVGRTGTLTLPGNISGNGFLSVDQAATVILTGTNNTWTAGPMINAGTLQIGDGGTNGSIGSGNITNYGTLAIVSARSLTVNNVIEGFGGLRFGGSGTQTLTANNPFTGNVVIGGAAVVRYTRPEAAGTGTNTVGQNNQDISRIELLGGLTLTNVLGFIPRAYMVADATVPNSAPHFLNVSGNNTLNPPVNLGLATGGNLLSLASESGNLVLTTGIEQRGTGRRYLLLGGVGNGEIQGPLMETLENNSLCVHKIGAGSWTLSGVSSFRGPTIISNGTFVVNGQFNEITNLVSVFGGALAGSGTLAGPVVVEAGGSLAPGVGAIGTITINNTLTLQADSTTVVEVNKAAGTSDKVLGLTSVVYGGTLQVANLGGTLAAGDSFPVFSAAAASGSFASITPAPGAGLSWKFDAATGVLSVTEGGTSEPTTLSFSVDGSSLNLSWPATHAGWYVQSNSVSIAAPESWFIVPGSQNATTLSVPINPGTPQVFYRLRNP